MHILLSIIIVLAILIGLGTLYTINKKRIEFFATGLDKGFSFTDLALLWKVAQICELEMPTALFFSMQCLTKCMAHITSQAASDGSEKDPKKQELITKLFNYRTKLQNETDDKKGLDSTMSLDRNQKLRVLLPGKGVFASKILNNGKEIFISVPRKKDMIPITAEEWVGRVVSVYLWRKGDARYVFDTVVTGHGLFVGESCISLKHSNNLVRTQKRKAVRAKCEIPAQLYIIRSTIIDYNAVETQNGYKCMIEDISESGAMIRIGGQGAANVQIKLQFNIRNMLIIMFGVVRTVEYNAEQNQSLLHFECIHIEPGMRNEVLSFVYNMLPEREKEVFEAISQTGDDEENESEGSETIENSEENLKAETEIKINNPEENHTEKEKSDVTSGQNSIFNSEGDLNIINTEVLPSLNDDEKEPGETLNIFGDYS